MKKYGLIGFPLHNTFSADYFAEKFRAAGLNDHAYQNYPLPDIREFPALLAQNPDLLGVNVTKPYKIAVIALLHDMDQTAAVTGAVNCVRIERDTAGRAVKNTGYNTDVWGFEHSFMESIPSHMAGALHQQKALILGTGGAAKAAAFVMHTHNIETTFVSRNEGEDAIRYEDLTERIMASHHIIVNCTPMGMFPNADEAPKLPYSFIGPDHFVFDMIYLPAETELLKLCREKGATVKNGLDMLHLQAERAWRIWRLGY